MKPQQLYSQSAAMEPLLPTAAGKELDDLTSEVFLKAGSLSAQIPSPVVRTRAAELVQQMNSYYSNLIEGHKTLPRDIERALRNDFSDDREKRASQHLARAHIEVEKLMRSRLQNEPDLSIHSREFLCWLHQEFYQRLPEELHWSSDRAGKRYKIHPGMLRAFEVVVGSHQPPDHRALPRMLDHFDKSYSSKTIRFTGQLIALAAAHHRLAWMHPFGDGNGRVTRLYSQAWIIKANVDALGLWTLSRGLARQRKSYYAALSTADQRRWNDLDGRGNLSDRALADFCVFILKTMLDQIEFMTATFQFQNLSKRIDHYLHFGRAALPSRDRERMSRLLKAALQEGQIGRGRVGEIVGLRGTAARQVIRLCLREGLLDSASEKGPLSLAFSSETLESYFPKLFQDLPVDIDN